MWVSLIYNSFKYLQITINLEFYVRNRFSTKSAAHVGCVKINAKWRKATFNK